MSTPTLSTTDDLIDTILRVVIPHVQPENAVQTRLYTQVADEASGPQRNALLIELLQSILEGIRPFGAQQQKIHRLQEQIEAQNEMIKQLSNPDEDDRGLLATLDQMVKKTNEIENVGELKNAIEDMSRLFKIGLSTKKPKSEPKQETIPQKHHESPKKEIKTVRPNKDKPHKHHSHHRHHYTSMDPQLKAMDHEIKRLESTVRMIKSD